jgi:hypothetical protein
LVESWETWLATIFVGRDGLVKGVHSAFASQTSGEFNTQSQEEFTPKIEKLLAENVTNQNASAEVSPLKRQRLWVNIVTAASAGHAGLDRRRPVATRIAYEQRILEVTGIWA